MSTTEPFQSFKDTKVAVGRLDTETGDANEIFSVSGPKNNHEIRVNTIGAQYEYLGDTLPKLILYIDSLKPIENRIYYIWVETRVGNERA